MSHQSGIIGSDEFREYLAGNKDGQIRTMKIGIENEKLVLQDSAAPSGTWEQDWDSQILPRLAENQPCFIMYRLDNRNDSGFEWIFISYSPDFSPVRQKMLYASTRSTLKKEFGGSQVKDEMFGTVPHDVNLVAFKKHVIAQHAPKPLTFAEEELETIKRNEVHTDIHVDSKHETAKGVSFPISTTALEKLKLLKEGQVGYVQLSLDLEKETINLETAENLEVGNLRSKIPKDHARYHFFNYSHTHEGDRIVSIVFIYSIPGYHGSIRERMLYSTCKNPLLNVAEQELGLEIARKIETDDPNELTPEFLYDEVHPKKSIVKEKFAKPKGPTGRGPKRMTKAEGDDDE